MLTRQLRLALGTSVARVQLAGIMSQPPSYSAVFSSQGQREKSDVSAAAVRAKEFDLPLAHNKTVSSSSSKTMHQRNREHSPKASSKGSYKEEDYHRNPEHESQTGREEDSHYVLTLLISHQLHQDLTAIRERHFPAHINKLSAHICLFRALPGSELRPITDSIKNVCRGTVPFKIAPGDAFRMKMGVGVSIGLGAKETEEVQKRLKDDWLQLGWLSRQDKGGFNAHVTVQNKVGDSETVNRSLAEVQEELRQLKSSRSGNEDIASGLGLWKYVRGYWHFHEGFQFHDRHV